MPTHDAGWPRHAEDEIAAVARVLASGRTNYWTGTECREFEREYAAFTGTEYALAVMNGTVALEAALHALEIGPGDEVITSSRTFIASASCIVMRGATPVIADVDPVSQNMTVETVAACLTRNTKAIIVVHLAGWPAEMPGILALARQHGLRVIEDCAQAHGAEISGQKVGSFGDIGAFSFCQDKILTTGGEGGMITTSDRQLWEKMWSYRDHGKNRDKVMQSTVSGGFRWLHDSFGTNLRMTEMQAAIGRLQLGKLPDWLAVRRENAARLTAAFRKIDCLRVTVPADTVQHACYKYYVFVEPDKLPEGLSRDAIVEKLNAIGIPCFTGSCSEIYLEQAFAARNLSPATPRPVAKMLGETSLMFQVDPSVRPERIGRIIEEMHKLLAVSFA